MGFCYERKWRQVTSIMRSALHRAGIYRKSLSPVPIKNLLSGFIDLTNILLKPSSASTSQTIRPQ